MTVYYYSKVSATNKEEYLLGYESGDVTTGDVKILKVSENDALDIDT